MFKKLLTILCLPILLAACSVGTVNVIRDEFTDRTVKVLNVGRIGSESTSIFSSHSISLKVFEVIGSHENERYILVFETNSCPLIRNGDNAIFMIGDKRFSSNAIGDSVVNTSVKISSRIAYTECIESGIAIGPISRDFLLHAADAGSLRFRIYGSRGNLTGVFDLSELQMIKKFVLTGLGADSDKIID